MIWELGHARITIDLKQELFFQVLGEKTGMKIENEGALLSCMMQFIHMKEQYDKLKDAYDDVLETGYGIVMPGIDELTGWKNLKLSNKAADTVSV